MGSQEYLVNLLKESKLIGRLGSEWLCESLLIALIR